MTKNDQACPQMMSTDRQTSKATNALILYQITRITTKIFVYSLKQEENRQTIKNVYDVYELRLSYEKNRQLGQWIIEI